MDSIKITKQSIEEIFYKIYCKEMNISEFEKWLYEVDNQEFEILMGKDFYFELIDINYREKYALELLEEKIYNRISFGYFETQKITRLLKSIIDREGHLGEHLDFMYFLYGKGYNFLRYLGLSYILNGLDNYPAKDEKLRWNDRLYGDKKRILDKISKNMIKEAERILEFIENKEIEITGEYEYIDNRRQEDKIELYALESMYSD